ncbi:MAG TPA: hypothetical protein VFH51_19095, partial [Myxococcota bacterium]|nr:hypothetical protein [Myxococcota bacterium]
MRALSPSPPVAPDAPSPGDGLAELRRRAHAVVELAEHLAFGNMSLATRSCPSCGETPSAPSPHAPTASSRCPRCGAALMYEHCSVVTPEQLAVQQMLWPLVETSKQLQALSQELADYVALHAGRLPLSLQPVDIHGVCTRVRASVMAACNAKDIGLHWVLPDAPSHAQADPSRLEQVLCKLTENAIE